MKMQLDITQSHHNRLSTFSGFSHKNQRKILETQKLKSVKKYSGGKEKLVSVSKQNSTVLQQILI